MPVKIRFQPGLKPIIQKHQSGQHDQEAHGNWASYPEELMDKKFNEYQKASREYRKKLIAMGVPERYSLGDIGSSLWNNGVSSGEINLTKQQLDYLKAEEAYVRKLDTTRGKVGEQWYEDHFENTNKTPNSFLGMNKEISDIRDEYVAKQIKGEDVSVITNRALRGSGQVSPRAKRFDKLVETSVVKEPVVLWRGAILPQNLVDSLQEGTSFIDKGFQSTGVRKNEATFYASERFRDQNYEGVPVIFKMKVNKGVNAVNVGYGETVVQRNTKMSIKSVKTGSKIQVDYDLDNKKPVYGPNFVVVDVEVDKAS